MRHEPERWKADYGRDGYLVVPGVLSDKGVDLLRKAVEKITDQADSLPDRLRRHIQFERDFVAGHPEHNEKAAEVGGAVRNIMELPLFDRTFADLICHEPLLDILEALFGTTEFAFHNYKCIVKAPRVSSSFLWHRDLPYLQHSTPNLITAMLCLDEMSEASGATVVLPGTHTIGHEKVTEDDMEIAESELPASARRVTVNCPPGSAVLFHVNIIHGGGPNRSERPRRNLISIWSGPDTHPVTRARYAFQGVMPRSIDPHRRRQMRMTFPEMFA